MSIKRKVNIVGIFEHPTRKAEHQSRNVEPILTKSYKCDNMNRWGMQP